MVTRAQILTGILGCIIVLLLCMLSIKYFYWISKKLSRGDCVEVDVRF